MDPCSVTGLLSIRACLRRICVFAEVHSKTRYGELNMGKNGKSPKSPIFNFLINVSTPLITDNIYIIIYISY